MFLLGFVLISVFLGRVSDSIVESITFIPLISLILFLNIQLFIAPVISDKSRLNLLFANVGLKLGNIYISPRKTPSTTVPVCANLVSN